MGMPRMGMEVLLVKKGGRPVWVLYHKFGACTPNLVRIPSEFLRSFCVGIIP